MKEDEKEILIAKMLDAPSSLSDEELDLILQDEELRALYETSAVLGSACMPQPEWDMNEEWKRFRTRMRHKPSKWRWVWRVASIFLGVILISDIVGWIIDRVFTYDEPLTVAKVEQFPEEDFEPFAEVPSITTEIKEETKQDPVISKSRSTITKNYQVKTEISEPQNTETVESEDVDIDEYLRIQQARIDNDLAVQTAETYREEYSHFAAFLDAAGLDDSALDDEIIKITME